MFSYYADDHYGIAVELQFSDFDVPCGIPCGDPNDVSSLYGRSIVFRNVEYLSNVPELNYHRLYGKHQLIFSLIFTKFEDWKHEKEFRIFRRNVAAGAVKFPERMLTKIIFGARTGKDEVDMVKSWLGSRTHPVVLSKIEPSKSNFALEVNDIETFTP